MTREQRRNLARLTMHVHGLPRGYDHFNIEVFAEGGDGLYVSPGAATLEFINACGTSACFLGHGPSAGIMPEGDESLDWLLYGMNAFTGDDNLMHNWLFHGSHINSRNKACLRAAWVLQGNEPIKGMYFASNAEVPEDFVPDWDLIKSIAEGTELSETDETTE